jgi:hypothetical protein
MEERVGLSAVPSSVGPAEEEGLAKVEKRRRLKRLYADKLLIASTCTKCDISPEWKKEKCRTGHGDSHHRLRKPSPG